MESKTNIKLQAALLIVGILIGLLAGYAIFSNINQQSKSSLNEVNILNKEINHCIDKLNQCSRELEQINNKPLD